MEEPAAGNTGALKAALSLETVFTASRLRDVFKDHVWSALRNQQCQDLLSYYDYRRLLDGRSEQLAGIITSGNYRPKASLPISISRADLLARHMHIPHPDDALVLQAISEALLRPIQDTSPSANAFFARSHQEHTGLHTQQQFNIYPWFRLWPRYQTKILKFAEVKDFLVITDVQNFFDSVAFSFIRRKLTSISNSLHVVDLMLLLFENFIRRDMYAPINLVGIPTIDVDAPRLVGHALLFDVDQYLSEQIGSNFARWLDDINFGVDTVAEARDHIRRIDARLRTVGLRLGGGKTRILSYAQARIYLQADENQRLNQVETQIKTKGIVTAAIARRLSLGFLRFRASAQAGYWDKVMRRYYRLVARARADLAHTSHAQAQLFRRVEAASREDFSDITTTEYRLAIITFWATLRITDVRLETYCDAFCGALGFDDAVAFALATLIASIKPNRGQARKFAASILTIAKASSSSGFFFGGAWFLAQHGTEREIVEFIGRTERSWEGNYFFARQAIALWSLLPQTNPAATRIRNRFAEKHDPDIASCVGFIDELRSVTICDESLRGFLPLNPHVRSVDIRRAIISSNVMRSPKLDPNQKRNNAERINALISDSRLRWIALGGTAVAD